MTPFAVRGDRSAAAQLFLWASIVAASIVVLTAWLQMRGGAAAGVVPPGNAYTSDFQATAAATTGGMLAGVQIAALIFANALQCLTGFVIAVWVHRAYANLKHLGIDTTYTPLAAAAYMVMPVANLIVPHAVFGELWRGSDPSRVRSLQRIPVRPIELVSKWWYLFIAYSVTSNVAAALLVRQGDPRSVQIVLAVAGILGVVAAIAGIDMIRLVDTRQAIRRSGQPTRNPVAAPVEAAVAAPAAPPVSGWREILLPVVTQIEREMQEEAVEAESVEAFELDEPAVIPRDLARPNPRPVSVLLLIAAVLAFLQSLGAVTNIFETQMPRLATIYLLFLPFAMPLYLVSLAIMVTFSFWLTRAYGNLRAYMTPPRSHLQASSDFMRRGGDPEVLAELWAVTMSLSNTPSASLVERWTRAWRGVQIFAVVSLLGLIFLPPRLELGILAVFFATIGWSAVLARRLVREVSATQATRLDALAARQARASAMPASPVPQASPQ